MVRREISSTASTKMGEAKPSLVSAARKRMQTPAAQIRMLTVTSRSRGEKGNIRAEMVLAGRKARPPFQAVFIFRHESIIADNLLNCR